MCSFLALSQMYRGIKTGSTPVRGERGRTAPRSFRLQQLGICFRGNRMPNEKHKYGVMPEWFKGLVLKTSESVMAP